MKKLAIILLSTLTLSACDRVVSGSNETGYSVEFKNKEKVTDIKLYQKRTNLKYDAYHLKNLDIICLNGVEYYFIEGSENAALAPVISETSLTFSKCKK